MYFKCCTSVCVIFKIFIIGSCVCCVHVGFENAMLQFVLKKFLLLVLLLDQAKLTRLIDYDPCLFLKESDIKVLSCLERFVWEIHPRALARG